MESKLLRLASNGGTHSRTHPLPNPGPNPSVDVLADKENDALIAKNRRQQTSSDKGKDISTAIVPAVVSASQELKKPRSRSGELVRVSAEDVALYLNVVRRTRMTFESLRFLAARQRNGEADRSPAPRTSPSGARRHRPDLVAAKQMGDRDLWLHRDRRIVGPIPGVRVGDVFFYRIELCVVALHGQVQGGIDTVPGGQSSTGEPIATSIVLAGGYEDNVDTGDVVIYTGHGGRERNNPRQRVNQFLQGGNLALERSMNYGVEVRLIRGLECERSPSERIYVYDGLYRVVDYWEDVGKSGFVVFKFKLVRLDGQEEMGSSVFKLAEDLKLKLNPSRKMPSGYLNLDISNKKEKLSVSLFNDVDDDRAPLTYEYIASPAYPPFLFKKRARGSGNGGCDCSSDCSARCACSKRNGGEFAYGENGLLLKGKPLIYECGPLCRCPQSCPNRVSQKGLRHRLEVFRSQNEGWGVRSLDLIRAGEFVCEFGGSVVTKDHAVVFSSDNASFVYPHLFPFRWKEWGDISDVDGYYALPSLPPAPTLGFSIDVSKTRNVACYLNHSSSPNVFVQFVLFDHYNELYPHVMIFAMENIPPLRELSIDYGVGIYGAEG